jgi:hypothetical protein
MTKEELDLKQKIEEFSKDLDKATEELRKIEKEKEYDYKWFDFVLIHGDNDGDVFFYRMKLRTDFDSIYDVLNDDSLVSNISEALNFLCGRWSGAMSCIPIEGCIFATKELDTFEKFKNYLHTDLVVTCLKGGSVSISFKEDLN